MQGGQPFIPTMRPVDYFTIKEYGMGYHLEEHLVIHSRGWR